MGKHQNQGGRWMKQVRQQIEDAGGSLKLTKDGHLAIYDREGRFLMKTRTAGKRTGDINRRSESVMRSVLKRV